MVWDSGSIYDAQAEQVEVGAAIHGSFDQLEAVNVPFDRSIAPWMLKGGNNGGFVAMEVFDQVGERAA